MEQRCRRCGGELRHMAVLANYKSFVVSLMRCQECGDRVELKENAHRTPSEARGGPRPAKATEAPPGKRRSNPAPAPADASRARMRARTEPAPAKRRLKPAKRIERPFNVRITRAKNRPDSASP